MPSIIPWFTLQDRRHILVRPRQGIARICAIPWLQGTYGHGTYPGNTQAWPDQDMSSVLQWNYSFRLCNWCIDSSCNIEWNLLGMKSCRLRQNFAGSNPILVVCTCRRLWLVLPNHFLHTFRLCWLGLFHPWIVWIVNVKRTVNCS